MVLVYIMEFVEKLNLTVSSMLWVVVLTGAGITIESSVRSFTLLIGFGYKLSHYRLLIFRKVSINDF